MVVFVRSNATSPYELNDLPFTGLTDDFITATSGITTPAYFYGDHWTVVVPVSSTQYTRTISNGYVDYSGHFNGIEIRQADGSLFGSLSLGGDLSFFDHPVGSGIPVPDSFHVWNGDDTFYGNNGNDIFIGYNGNDTFNAFEGANRIDGGGGNRDTVVIGASLASVSFTHNDDNSWTLAFGNSYDLVKGVELLQLNDATLALRERATHDLDGSGRGEAFLYNTTTHEFGSFSSTGQFNLVDNYPYLAPAAVGDVDGDGRADVIYRGTSPNDEIFFGHSGNFTHVGNTSSDYTVIGTGYFNSDNVEDILFRQNATGEVGYWKMNDYTSATPVEAYHSIGSSSTSYSVVGIGDFDGNGTSDILFRNNSTGDTGFYRTVNGAFGGWGQIGSSSTAYAVVGVGDFNGDGTSDVLFRNAATGDTGYYEIHNGAFVGWRSVGSSSTTYQVGGVGDYDNDGDADIFFHNPTSGDNGYYEMQNGHLAAWHQLQNVGTDYAIIHV